MNFDLDLSEDPRRQAALNPPRYRGVMHSWAAPVSFLAGLVVVLIAPTWESKVLLGIMCLSNTTMLTISATFHRLQWSDAQWWKMRQLDMTGIYFLIAGSYTGVAGVAMEDPWRTRLIVVVWVGTIIGIVIRWLPFEAPFGFTTVLFILVGSTVLLAIGELYDALGTAGFVLLIAGCMLYLFGGFMLGARWPNPVPGVFGYHEVWHTFVTLAVILHYLCIFVAVLPKA